MQITKQNKSKNAVENLFDVGAHFGFIKSRRHPSAKPFLFGVKNNIEIFDLEKTSLALETAKAYAKGLGEANAQILFVGGKSEARNAVKLGAESLGMPYVAGRWIGGTITNFPEIRRRVMKLERLTTEKEKGELAKYTKKERLLIDREIARLKLYFEGLIPMKELPKAIFIIDSKKEHIALTEARDRNIPTLGLCGSDCDLTEVNLPIPANDASAASISFFVREIVDAYKEGRSAAAKK